MKQITEQETYLRLAALCAQAEHCQYEMQEKMRRWELPEEAQARVMQRLVTERYVDDERYARAFIKDKVRYTKHIDEGIRQRVLDEVDDEEYIAVLRPLLQQKRKSVKANSDYELNGKLMKFAMSRGFTMDIIRQCINVTDEDEFLD